MSNSRTFRRRLGVTGVAAALVFGGVACGNGDDATSAAPQTTAAMAEPDASTSETSGSDAMAASDTVLTSSPAAELRATLTAGLQEHVYLAGIAVYAAVNTPEAFDPAVAALDENSVALSEAVGGIYGADAGEAFLGLWRTHIDMFVAYTQGRAAGDQAAVDAALADLDAYAGDFGAFLEGANPNFDADDIAENLGMHVGTLTAAIDAVVAGEADGFTKLRAAAGHMSMTAQYLADGIARQHPDDFGA
jgi:hypothetical protein